MRSSSAGLVGLNSLPQCVLQFVEFTLKYFNIHLSESFLTSATFYCSAEHLVKILFFFREQQRTFGGKCASLNQQLNRGTEPLVRLATQTQQS